MTPDEDFQRWLEVMARRAVNMNSSKPIVGKYAGRRVWFWRDGSTLSFDTDKDGCIMPTDEPTRTLTTSEWFERQFKLKSRTRQVESERETVTNQKLSRAQVVQSQLKALQAELAHLARFPEDDFENGTVLQVVKTYKRHVLTPTETGRFRVDPNNSEIREDRFTYVLLKANDQWWCTGQNGHQINGASWDKVIEFVDEDELIDVRTGLSVMTDATQPQEPTLVDVLGEERAAQVEAFLANPETGVTLERPKRQHQEGEYLRPTLKQRRPDTTGD